jgi:hypothetical protein
MLKWRQLNSLDQGICKRQAGECHRFAHSSRAQSPWTVAPSRDFVHDKSVLTIIVITNTIELV